MEIRQNNIAQELDLSTTLWKLKAIEELLKEIEPHEKQLHKLGFKLELIPTTKKNDFLIHAVEEPRKDECYKTGEECKHNCPGQCRESC